MSPELQLQRDKSSSKKDMLGQDTGLFLLYILPCFCLILEGPPPTEKQWCLSNVFHHRAMSSVAFAVKGTPSRSLLHPGSLRSFLPSHACFLSFFISFSLNNASLFYSLCESQWSQNVRVLEWFYFFGGGEGVRFFSSKVLSWKSYKKFITFGL